MSPRFCGFYKSRCMGSLVIQMQVYPVGPGVIVQYPSVADVVIESKYVESVNPGIFEV